MYDSAINLSYILRSIRYAIKTDDDALFDSLIAAIRHSISESRIDYRLHRLKVTYGDIYHAAWDLVDNEETKEAGANLIPAELENALSKLLRDYMQLKDPNGDHHAEEDKL